jgi:ergothioneine biosynthesis protein EgtB
MATQTSSTVLRQLQRRLLDARANTDELFSMVRESAYYERPIPERHRIVFYIGHVEAFDWNLFHERLFALPSPTREYDKLFAFGIDPVDGGLPTDKPEDWPSLGEVRHYVHGLRARIDEKLNGGNFSLAEHADPRTPEILLETAVEHRLMHAETLAYMFHRLPHAQKIPQPQPAVAADFAENDLVEIPAGRVTLGLPRGAASPFGWDNEFECVSMDVPGFRIQKYMVSNGEFLRFLEAGGYQDRAFWPAEDWEWKERNEIRHPAFWKPAGENWLYRGMFAEMALPRNWPVYVSHAEAGAYARWSRLSLPTEAQWHRAAYGVTGGEERAYPWGAAEPTALLGNFDCARWDAAPVNGYPANRSAFGVSGMLGNGWEWTSTPFGPFPGFQAEEFYPGYSANFFDGKHYVIKGGSARTAACLLRRSFRNWFQPHYQYVYAGFRCVSE